MTLTATELERLEIIEQTIINLQNLVEHAASENMLNRLLALANEENRKTREEVSNLSDSLDLLIERVNKLL